MAFIGQFENKDLKVSWTRNPANEATGAITLHYFVEFFNGAIKLRDTTVVNPEVTYYYDDMLIDRPGGPVRDITVKVYEVDTFLTQSAPAEATFTNDPPQVPTFSTTTTVDTVIIDIDYLSESDRAGYYICRSTTSGFAPASVNVIYQGSDLKFIDKNLTFGVNYYYRVGAYDKFSYTLADLNFSAEQVAVGPSLLEFDEVNIEFDNIEFDVSGNTVSWTGGQAIRLFNGLAETKAVIAGNYTWTSGKVYIFFDWASGSVLTTTIQANAFSGRDNRVIAVYSGGTDLYVGTQKPIIDGNNIIAGTVGAGQLIATDVVISQSAQINNAIITNVKILDGEITVDKLDTANFSATGLALFGNDLQSSNYVTGSQGWQINNNGNAEFNNLVTRGWITVGAISDFVEYNSVGFTTIPNASIVTNLYNQSYTCPASNFLFFGASIDLEAFSASASPGDFYTVECILSFADNPGATVTLAFESYTMLTGETRTTHANAFVSDNRSFNVYWRVSNFSGNNGFGQVDNAKYFTKVVQR